MSAFKVYTPSRYKIVEKTQITLHKNATDNIHVVLYNTRNIANVGQVQGSQRSSTHAPGNEETEFPSCDSSVVSYLSGTWRVGYETRAADM